MTTQQLNLFARVICDEAARHAMLAKPGDPASLFTIHMTTSYVLGAVGTALLKVITEATNAKD